MSFLDKLPLSALVVFALFLLVAPITPEPHLVQKFKMLTEGTLVKPLDLFDVFWHLLGVVLLVLKIRRGGPAE